MSFIAANFIYNGTISSDYGLRITTDDKNSPNRMGADVTLHTQSIFRRPQNYLLGVQQAPVLSIPIRIDSPVQLAQTENSVVSKWLFGQMNYGKLQIIQYDMYDVYYNCIFTAPILDEIGNMIVGYYSTIICDSPFAWENSNTVNYTGNMNGYVSIGNMSINNTSDNPDYTYPTLMFTMNSFGGNLIITNANDAGRQFIFTGLSAGEKITIDNNFQIITSSISGVNRLPNFNYNWMRYVPGINNLSVNGNISSLSSTQQFARKMS